MTLDDAYLNQRELLRRDKERDDAARKAAADEQRLLESSEAEEARWVNRFRQSAREIPRVYYQEGGRDRRLFGP